MEVDRSAGSPALRKVDKEIELLNAAGESTIVVSFSRHHGMPLGLSLDNLDNRYLLISDDPTMGVAKAHNEDCQGMNGGYKSLHRGHFITQVNGARANATAMLRMLRTEPTVHLEIYRPEPFVVRVERSTKGLGMDVNFAPGCRSLQVLHVLADGALGQWNAQIEKMSGRLLKGDCIIKVNSQSGPSKELLDLLQVQDCVELTVVRPPLEVSVDDVKLSG